jgi:hypothetical protein
MTMIIALALLAALALILLHPRGLVSETLVRLASAHRRTAIGTAGFIAVLLLVLAMLPGRGGVEADVQGYGELWYMTQTNPGVRDQARKAMADGVLTNDELQQVRALYRQAPDVAAMRAGIAQELGR